MSRSIQIKFVHTSTDSNSPQQIRYIGGVDPAGVRWRLSEADAIAGMESGNWRFYATIDGHAVWLTIAHTPDGHKYLKAMTDAVTPDPLLSLSDNPIG